MPRNLLLLHYQKDEVQLELLKINVLYIGWIPRNFKILIFNPKLPFLSENDKMIIILDFQKFTLHMILKIFHENSHYRNGHGESVKFKNLP